jgi:3-isopropylmalate/(R)-2-methylmalate dehydratase small subunit
MEPFTKTTSIAAPLPLRDVDTDMIIPATFLTSVSRDGYGENVFRRLRDQDPNFPFNRPEFDSAQILVVDDNFGCGSSREHAVWALTGRGLKVIIGKSFADIFASNSGKNGLLLVTLPEAIIDAILKASTDGSYEISVDLESQTVLLPDGSAHNFEIDPFRKHCLLSGLDDIDYIRSHSDDIVAFRTEQSQYRFFASNQPNR